MTEQELFKLGEICVQLGNSVQKCGQKYYMSQLKAIYDIVKCIDSNMDVKEKTKYILSLVPSSWGIKWVLYSGWWFCYTIKIKWTAR